MVETRTVVAVSAASAAIAVAGYMVYFDYKRRNDPEFRKKLRKEKKKAAKSAKEGEVETPSAPGRSPEELKAMLDQISAEPLPTLPADREKYFMDHVGMGEQMLLRGPAFEVPAALAFYRALRAYPSPVEIIMIFQNTLPPHIFALVMQLASLDVSSSESELASKPAGDKESTTASTSNVPAPESTPAPAAVSVPPVSERAPTPPTSASVQETESEHDSEVMVDADVDTEVEVEGDSEAEADTKADAMSEPEVVSAAHSEPGAESPPEIVPDPETKDSTEAQDLSYAEVAAKAAELEPESTPAQGSEPAPVPESHRESAPEPESIAPRDPAAVPLGSDSEDDSRSDAHSETDSYHQVTASQDGHSDWDSLAASHTSLPPQNTE